MTELDRATRARYFLNHLEYCCRREEESWSPISKASSIVDQYTQDELDLVEARATLEALLPNLGAREREVIKLRFFDNLTLRRTGYRVGLTGEAVRQIQSKAVYKLRRAAGGDEAPEEILG